MQIIKIRKWLVAASSMVYAALGNATIFDPHDITLDFAMGPTWFHGNTAETVFKANEINRNMVQSTPLWPTYRLGLGYFFEKVGPSAYLMDILFQLNWYNSQTNINGEVWQNGDPLLNNQTFRAPLTSNRLMFDIKPILFTFEGFSFYPFVGLGAAWSTLSYQERPTNPSSSINSINLKAHTNSTFSYDLGVGVGHHFTPHLGVFVEYLYNNINNISPSAVLTTPVREQITVLGPPTFGVRDQAVLFGLSWLI